MCVCVTTHGMSVSDSDSECVYIYSGREARTGGDHTPSLYTTKPEWDTKYYVAFISSVIELLCVSAT